MKRKWSIIVIVIDSFFEKRKEKETYNQIMRWLKRYYYNIKSIIEYLVTEHVTIKKKKEKEKVDISIAGVHRFSLSLHYKLF